MAHHHVHYADDYESRHHSPHHHPHGSRARELLAGAAAFAAFHAFEAHQRAEGRHVSHPLAKELLAALVAAEVEKLIETKGREMFNEWTGFFEDAKARSHRLYWEKYERPHAVLEIEGGHEHGRPHGVIEIEEHADEHEHRHEHPRPHSHHGRMSTGHLHDEYDWDWEEEDGHHRRREYYH